MIKRFVDYDVLSEVGRRKTNEDKSLCEVKGGRETDNRVILAVADGMGGLNAGEVASKAVYDELLKFYGEGFSGDLSQISRKVESCIKNANRGIHEWSQKKVGARVGTTVSGAVIIGNRYLTFNVGDSRTYIINAKGITQLTDDHSADWEAYEVGILKKEDIGRSKYSNAVTRSVGTSPDVKVDIEIFQSESNVLKEGDILFSCTDGLWGNVTDEEIKRVFYRERDIKKALEALYKLAYKNGSKDNISMAAYRYGGIAGRQELEIKKDIKKTLEALQSGDKVPKQKKSEKKIRKNINLKTFLYASIGLFLIVVAFLVYYWSTHRGKAVDDGVIESKLNLSARGLNASVIKSMGIEKKAQGGGVIKFEPDGGKFRDKDNVIVRLSIVNPLKSPKGDEIDADIYYTLDGSEPTKDKGRKYKDNEPIAIKEIWPHTLKARALSKVGKYMGSVYSQTYTIENIGPSPLPPPVKVIGGTVRFDKGGGEYKGPLQIQLTFEPLQFSNGNPIESDLYYTTGVGEPVKIDGKRYSSAKVDLTTEKTYPVKAWVTSKDGQHKGTVYSQTYIITIQQAETVIDGKITFSKPGGDYTGSVQVQINFEPPRFSSGKVIESDIYYAIKGDESMKNNAKPYSPGEKIELNKEGKYTIEAGFISKDGKYKGVYSQEYNIQQSDKQKPPPIVNLEDLDNTSTLKEEIKEKMKGITIDVDKIKNIEQDVVVLQISILKTGKSKMLGVSGFEVNPTNKLGKIKSELDKKIQDMTFTPYTIQGTTVDIRVRISFKKIAKYFDKIIFEL